MLPITLVSHPDLINVRNLDLAPLPMLARMMRYGTAIDLDYLSGLSEELGDTKSDLEREIRKHVPAHKFAEWKGKAEVKEDEEGDDEEAGVEDSALLSFNINSPEQVAWFLFDTLGLGEGQNLKRTPDGKRISTGKKQLEVLKGEHEVVKLLLDYREAAKLKSTYADALPHKAVLHPKGRCPYCSIPGDERSHREAHYRVHTTFTSTRAATGRLASKAPNLQQIPKRSKMGKRIRAAFIPQPGMKWVSADFSQIELRILAHYSNDPYMRHIYDIGGDIHSMTAMKAFGILQSTYDSFTEAEKKEFEDYKRLPCKNVNFGICIAKGQRVLTNYGLVPIENVRRWMLVWDGHSFVRHDGVVHKGQRRVIHHDGLWATPSHKVWIEGGGTATLETARASGLRLAITGNQTTPIRYTHDHVQHNLLQKWLPLRGRDMFPLWGGEGCERGQHQSREDHGMSVQTEIRRPSHSQANGTLARHGQSLYQKNKQAMEGLRREGDQGTIQVGGGVCRVCTEESPSSDVRKDQHRPYQQRRTLRSWESTPSHPRGEPSQHPTEYLRGVSGGDTNSDGCSRQDDERLSRVQIGQGVHRPVATEGSSMAGAAEYETSWTVQEDYYEEVYDILNAGPSRRFTVEGKLVSNCYGLTAKGLQAQLVLSNIYWTEEECQLFIDRWFAVFVGVHPYMKQQEYRALTYGYVWDLWGRVRWCPGIHSAHKRIIAEALREAGNMPIQASSAGLTKYTMALMESRDRTMYDIDTARYNPLLTIHDEVIYEAEEGIAEDLLALNLGLMSSAIELRVPVAADGKVKERW